VSCFNFPFIRWIIANAFLIGTAIDEQAIHQCLCSKRHHC
jgi:hypothetical protein